MISSFRDKGTEDVFSRRFVRRLPIGIQRGAQRKLAILDAAEVLKDLRIPPGNRLKKLVGDRAGQYSIRINDQWRICFRWNRGDAFDVEIADYHWELAMTNEGLQPVCPGEILLEEYLKPMLISQYRLAKDISVSPRRINEIVHGKRSITADTALRLSRYFGTSERFWLNLQIRYDLEIEKERLAGCLDKEVSVLSEAG